VKVTGEIREKMLEYRERGLSYGEISKKIEEETGLKISRPLVCYHVNPVVRQAWMERERKRYYRKKGLLWRILRFLGLKGMKGRKKGRR